MAVRQQKQRQGRIFIRVGVVCLVLGGYGVARVGAQESAVPKVNVSTSRDPARSVVAAGTQANRGNAGVPTNYIYPWKTHVTCSVFWIGETPTSRNPTPNYKSSWDQNWKENYGGFDDPAPENRILNMQTGEFRPKAFMPKLNPFYIALPYNDVESYKAHKVEATRVIPWFSQVAPEPGKTVCKGRWLQIFWNGRSCFAQWEDCGPWVTDDWEYVFGNKPPKNLNNKGAGIDISPAVRDFLGVKSGDKLHWRFVEARQVPNGPWKKYGQPAVQDTRPAMDDDQKRLEYLRKLRDQEYLKKPVDRY